MALKRALAAFATLIALAQPALADKIVVTNYGVTIGGWPYAIALAKGFFKEEGADITEILTSGGGGTTIRNILAANVPYGEVGASVALAANAQGANLRIISETLPSLADLMWVVKQDSPLKTLADLKGRKLGYTNPRSVTQGLAGYVVKAAGLKPEEVTLVKTGGFGEGLTALELGTVDATPLPQPLFATHGSKYRVLARGVDVLPPMSNTVGVTTAAAAVEKGETIKAVIRARRRGVEFLYSHQDEAAKIIAATHNLSPEAVKSVLASVAQLQVKQGIPYFGTGQISLGGIQRMMELQKEIGATDKVLDARPAIDTSFLPRDLQALKP